MQDRVNRTIIETKAIRPTRAIDLIYIAEYFQLIENNRKAMKKKSKKSPQNSFTKNSTLFGKLSQNLKCAIYAKTATINIGKHIIPSKKPKRGIEHIPIIKSESINVIDLGYNMEEPKQQSQFLYLSLNWLLYRIIE